MPRFHQLTFGAPACSRSKTQKILSLDVNCRDFRSLKLTFIGTDGSDKPPLIGSGLLPSPPRFFFLGGLTTAGPTPVEPLAKTLHQRLERLMAAQLDYPAGLDLGCLNVCSSLQPLPPSC